MKRLIRHWPRRWILPFWRAGRLWLRHDCVDLSAAFAYHSLQSVLPALLIALSVASRILGRDEGIVMNLVAFAARWLPETSLQGLEDVVERFLSQGFGAGLFGVMGLLLTASNAYLTLQRGADRLWWHRPFGFDHLPFRSILNRYVRLRLKALALVALFGFLIGLDQLVTNNRLLGSLDLRSALLQWLPSSFAWQRPVTLGVDLLVSVVITFAASLLLLWVLPSRRIRWRPLLPGATLSALALTLLNLLLGRTLVLLGVRFQAYGLVGGVLLLTLWVWLVGVILYYAQCLSVVCAPKLLSTRESLPA